MRRDILGLLRLRGKTNRGWESVLWRGHTLRGTSKTGAQNLHLLPSFLFPSQGALEIPVSTKPSTGVQSLKGWS